MKAGNQENLEALVDEADSVKAFEPRKISIGDERNITVTCGPVTVQPENPLLGEERVEFFLSLEHRQNSGRSSQVGMSIDSYEQLKDICLRNRWIIESMLRDDLKGLILQNQEIQIYAMEEVESEGFLVHFEDRKRAKVSMSAECFRRLLRISKVISVEHASFKRSVKESRPKKASGCAAKKGGRRTKDSNNRSK